MQGTDLRSHCFRQLIINKGDKSKLVLEATPLPWLAIARSWEMERASRVHRKDFLSGFTVKPGKRPFKEGAVKDDDAAEEDEAEESDAETSDIDELIEQLKRDPTLDQYEQRLLGSIVNPKSMPTTFAQVHLPPATIDSIRTIVSLPLLHPSAFGYGILKQHTMNGALLFGAPGTGKTLSIRALARESGARMMIIKPSDVMDMVRHVPISCG
jgi:SpoVK/Ycf46/Vps4 family AAA+-type ATPase